MAGTVEIMNLKQGKPTEPYDVKVDRTTPVGNPFPMGPNHDRDAVCRMYREWFEDNHYKGEVKEYLDRILALLKEHGQVRLWCWCAPERCHAETIKRWLERRWIDYRFTLTELPLP